MNLCVAVEGSPHFNATHSSSSFKWTGMSTVIKSIQFLYYHDLWHVAHGRLASDVGEVPVMWSDSAHSPTPSITSPTSQLILQLFCCFTYVTAHSPTLLSLHLCHSSFSNHSVTLLHYRHFTYISWQATHDVAQDLIKWKGGNSSKNDRKHTHGFNLGWW